MKKATFGDILVLTGKPKDISKTNSRIGKIYIEFQYLSKESLKIAKNSWQLIVPIIKHSKNNSKI